MKQPIAVWITDTHLSESTIEINFSVFMQAFALCASLGVDTIFHGGDIFNSRKGQPEIVLNAFKGIIDIAAEQGMKIIAIAGNHDKQSYVSSTSFLDAFDGHPAFTCISPFGQLLYENIMFHFIPFYDEALAYDQYLNKVEASEKNINVLLTHVGIDGIKNNGGTKVENKLKQSEFDKFDLVLVGHYHDRQIVGTKNQIVYTGSAYQANFGEDISKGATIIYDDGTYSFEQFEFPQYITAEINAEDINATLVNDVKAIVEKENNKIRFKVRGEVTETQKSIVSNLQQFSKVEITKESYKPIDVIQNETISISDIGGELDKWAIDKNIEDLNYGKELLMKNV